MQDKITLRQLEAVRRKAVESGKTVMLWDTDLKGFGLIASPTAASWIVQRWVGGRGGKAKRVVIGRYPEWSLERAKKEAPIALGQLGKGVDLVEEKKQERQKLSAEINGATLRSAFEKWYALGPEKAKKGKSGAYWYEVGKKYERDILPALGERTLVTAITRHAIRDLIESKQAVHPVAARNMYGALNPFFIWCVDRYDLPFNPMDRVKQPRKAEARERQLTPIEIKLVWQATEAMGYPFGPFYKLCLLTGQRREEVAGIHRTEIKGDEWHIPGKRTKNSQAHIVHLSPQALAVLREIKHNHDLLFTTTRGESSISGFRFAKRET